MKNNTTISQKIHCTALLLGAEAAVRATRQAFESGRLESSEMCELMLALRRGVWPADSHRANAAGSAAS